MISCNSTPYIHEHTHIHAYMSKHKKKIQTMMTWFEIWNFTTTGNWTSIVVLWTFEKVGGSTVRASSLVYTNPNTHTYTCGILIVMTAGIACHGAQSPEASICRPFFESMNKFTGDQDWVHRREANFHPEAPGCTLRRHFALHAISGDGSRAALSAGEDCSLLFPSSDLAFFFFFSVHSGTCHLSFILPPAVC